MTKEYVGYVVWGALAIVILIRSSSRHLDAGEASVA